MEETNEVQAKYKSSLLLTEDEKPNIRDGLLPKDALFDKVINLKFKTGKGDVYTIRSDYELEQHLAVDNKTEKGVEIHRCHVKPQIKVSYEQVTSGIAISVDLQITNFHVFTQNSAFNLERFSFAGNKITEIEIAVGYFPQFTRPTTAEEWKNNIGGKDVSTIKIKNLVVPYYSKKPPNSIFAVHGFCSTFSKDDGSILTSDIETVSNKYTIKVASNGTETLKNIFDTLVTHRYITSSDGDTPQKDKNGLYDDATARQIGVKVKMLPWTTLSYTPSDTVDEKQKKVTPKSFVCTGGDTLVDTLRLIKRDYCPTMVFAQTKDGNVVVWDSATLPTSVIEKQELTANDPFTIIPAVYQINANAGLCTISCPFFGFIDPFQKLRFNSRYQLTNVVNSLARSVNYVVDFYNVSSKIEFATVDNLNNATLSAIGLNYS